MVRTAQRSAEFWENAEYEKRPAVAETFCPDSPVQINVLTALPKGLKRASSAGTTRNHASTSKHHSRTVPSLDNSPPPDRIWLPHVGHMFSYTQTDVIASITNGKNVLYPPGWGQRSAHRTPCSELRRSLCGPQAVTTTLSDLIT